MMSDKSKFWTACYETPTGGCYSVQFGDENGPDLDRQLAHRLAHKYRKDHPEKVRSLCFIEMGPAREHGLWDRLPIGKENR